VNDEKYDWPDRRCERRRVHEDRGEHDEQRGEEPSRATRPERAERDATGAVPLAQQQPGDQEAGQHEERVERQHSARREVASVDADREPDREAAPTVERGPVQARRTGRAGLACAVSCSRRR
jgi:hypothetical protein